ncbi:hypothetical protein LCGC14_0424500 [marine sediment metagenome]|uniref:Uncharacterized protein n=1 Tax=marine sediment metagenome TaxID=412755 RepID=A0A0F9VZ40_9ZZZZ
MSGNLNIPASTKFRIQDVIDPDAYAAGTEVTDWLPAADYANHMSLISVGTMAATSTVDAKLEQAQDAAGLGAKDIANKAITQLTAAGADDDKQAIINLRPDELDTINDFTHFRLSVTTAVAASDSAAYVFGTDARYEPETDATSVDEIVS